jgi:3-phenylpropionate/trans-cinnamate dioxygenase ferredoxin reductase subunit
MVGLSTGATAEIIRGSVEAKKFSIFYLRDGRLIGIDSVNAPGDHMLGRRLLGRRPEVSADQLTDPGFDLKSLL